MRFVGMLDTHTLSCIQLNNNKEKQIFGAALRPMLCLRLVEVRGSRNFSRSPLSMRICVGSVMLKLSTLRRWQDFAGKAVLERR